METHRDGDTGVEATKVGGKTILTDISVTAKMKSRDVSRQKIPMPSPEFVRESLFSLTGKSDNLLMFQVKKLMAVKARFKSKRTPLMPRLRMRMPWW